MDLAGAGVLLAHFEKASHVTFYEPIGPIAAVRYSMVGHWNFPTQMFAVRFGPGIYKKCSVKNFIHRSQYKQLTWSIYVYFIYG